jgi:hypothetical protein
MQLAVALRASGNFEDQTRVLSDGNMSGESETIGDLADEINFDCGESTVGQLQSRLQHALRCQIRKIDKRTG